MHVQLTQEMVDQAGEQENKLILDSPERLKVENEYLQQRVVLLRATVNQLEQQLQELTPTKETEAGEGVEPQAS